METKNINQEIQSYILKIINDQFMYSDEIVDKCLEFFEDKISTPNPKLSIKNQIKILSDEKLIAYYHGYKITAKGKAHL
ncbi:MAG: hypothetical protein CL762_04205 [Chloroflexi bacterium]|nr:hypothetical protein [Chloroflexota bacterium]